MIIEHANLSASLGQAIYQDERLKFEAKTVLTNTGHTPAYNVTFSANAAILNLPVPLDFDYPLPASGRQERQFYVARID
jgi:hypothetical protein